MPRREEEVHYSQIMEAIDFATDVVKKICYEHDVAFQACRFRVKNYTSHQGMWIVTLSGLTGSARNMDFEISQQAGSAEIYGTMYKRVASMTATTGHTRVYVPGVTPVSYKSIT